jgi:hypothetical protein
MNIERGLNPTNKKQARVFFSYLSAEDAGEARHAETVMTELAAEKGFAVIGKCPQTLFDGWDYWIEFHTAPELPLFFQDSPWKPVGQA